MIQITGDAYQAHLWIDYTGQAFSQDWMELNGAYCRDNGQTTGTDQLWVVDPQEGFAKG